MTYPLYKAAVLAINAAWRAPWACAEVFRSGTISVPDVEIVPGLVATALWFIIFWRFRSAFSGIFFANVR